MSASLWPFNFLKKETPPAVTPVITLTYTIEKVIPLDGVTHAILKLSNGKAVKLTIAPQDFLDITTATDARILLEAKINELLAAEEIYGKVINLLKKAEGGAI